MRVVGFRISTPVIRSQRKTAENKLLSGGVGGGRRIYRTLK